MATQTFLQTAGDETDLTTYTFSTQGIGTAASDRYIIIHVVGYSTPATTPTISSATIGGVTATVDVEINNGRSYSGIIKALVPTGTTADVVITMAVAMQRLGIGMWRAVAMGATATDSGTSTADAPTNNLTIAASGIAFAGVMNVDVGPAAWTGLTERYDTDPWGAGAILSGASDNFASAQTELAITCTLTAIFLPAGVFISYPNASAAGVPLLSLLGAGV